MSMFSASYQQIDVDSLCYSREPEMLHALHGLSCVWCIMTLLPTLLLGIELVAEPILASHRFCIKPTVNQKQVSTH